MIRVICQWNKIACGCSYKCFGWRLQIKSFDSLGNVTLKQNRNLRYILALIIHQLGIIATQKDSIMRIYLFIHISNCIFFCSYPYPTCSLCIYMSFFKKRSIRLLFLPPHRNKVSIIAFLPPGRLFSHIINHLSRWADMPVLHPVLGWDCWCATVE